MSMFDPSLPQENTPVDAVQMRGQFTGLKDLIDAVPTISGVVVDAVNTLPAGSAAMVEMMLTGSTLHFTFSIPQGPDGAQGMPGQDGGPGAIGPQGPPFATAVVDAVNTLPAGSPASVGVNFDGTYVRFTFAIPQGYDGPTGPQGPPGEVTHSALDAAINGTSANSNAVPTMDLPFTNDPPTLADLETMRAAYNTLVLALRRP